MKVRLILSRSTLSIKVIGSRSYEKNDIFLISPFDSFVCGVYVYVVQVNKINYNPV